MWAQGQYNMALKCIGISEEHVTLQAFPMSIFVDTCVCVCVSLHVTNDNGMNSIRRGHFIQNVMPILSNHREAPVLETLCVH